LLDRIHEHEFVSLLLDTLSDIMQAHLCSCANRGVGIWLLAHPTTLAFCLFSIHFLTRLRTYFGLPHLMITHPSQCQCGHTITNLDIHLLQCLFESERTTTHDTFWNIITTIILNSGAHVQREVSHLFLHHTQWWMDILITRGDFQTLMDVVIADSIHTNMV